MPSYSCLYKFNIFYLLDLCTNLHNGARFLHVDTDPLTHVPNTEAETAATNILNSGETSLSDTFGQNTMILKSCCEISVTEGITKSFQDW